MNKGPTIREFTTSFRYILSIHNVPISSLSSVNNFVKNHRWCKAPIFVMNKGRPTREFTPLPSILSIDNLPISSLSSVNNLVKNHRWCKAPIFVMNKG
ncbi:hypothetical protein AVEN_58296-1 [Araneus ventricosus]|uniref:Uncharacterized protein n=1 Tax=Araneus ventricosus TaxID=182803 RepID=A0A4Y2J224_ARAVE|nr:hypothetical protein AVEN_58296-1 [Araneus ventricosus]